MNKEPLGKHIKAYFGKHTTKPAVATADQHEHQDRTAYYQSWSEQRLQGMSEEELGQYISRLWAMRIWGNKQYVVDGILHRHGLDMIRTEPQRSSDSLCPLSAWPGIGTLQRSYDRSVV